MREIDSATLAFQSRLNELWEEYRGGWRAGVRDWWQAWERQGTQRGGGMTAIGKPAGGRTRRSTCCSFALSAGMYDTIAQAATVSRRACRNQGLVVCNPSRVHFPRTASESACPASDPLSRSSHRRMPRRRPPSSALLRPAAWSSCASRWRPRQRMWAARLSAPTSGRARCRSWRKCWPPSWAERTGQRRRMQHWVAGRAACPGQSDKHIPSSTLQTDRQRCFSPVPDQLPASCVTAARHVASLGMAGAFFLAVHMHHGSLVTWDCVAESAGARLMLAKAATVVAAAATATRPAGHDMLHLGRIPS